MVSTAVKSVDSHEVVGDGVPMSLLINYLNQAPILVVDDPEEHECLIIVINYYSINTLAYVEVHVCCKCGADYLLP